MTYSEILKLSLPGTSARVVGTLDLQLLYLFAYCSVRITLYRRGAIVKLVILQAGRSGAECSRKYHKPVLRQALFLSEKFQSF